MDNKNYVSFSLKYTHKVTIHIKMKNALTEMANAMSKQFIKSVFSSTRKTKKEIRNITIRATATQNQFSVELRYEKHNNIIIMDIKELLILIENDYLINFKQCLIQTQNMQIQILMNKKFESKIIKKISSPLPNPKNKTTHNKTKKYLIPDNEKCDFLIKIGVMDTNGKVLANQYKKFRQINRFLEMVDDFFKNESQTEISIVDFGCGKSYLTFALYFYFKEIKNIIPFITGIDLKQDVIDHCNLIATELKYQNLIFEHGLIQNYQSEKNEVDFVVTLHACDTATDDAILFSLAKNAKHMMFVPCCQHELNSQIKNTSSQILLKHGIFKERLTSLITDTMRAQLLEICGYKVQCLEFIESAHTAKNILLRCKKIEINAERKKSATAKYLDFKNQWNISPYLEKKLLEQKLL